MGGVKKSIGAACSSPCRRTSSIRVSRSSARSELREDVFGAAMEASHRNPAEPLPEIRGQHDGGVPIVANNQQRCDQSACGPLEPGNLDGHHGGKRRARVRRQRVEPESRDLPHRPIIVGGLEGCDGIGRPSRTHVFSAAAYVDEGYEVDVVVCCVDPLSDPVKLGSPDISASGPDGVLLALKDDNVPAHAHCHRHRQCQASRPWHGLLSAALRPTSDCLLTVVIGLRRR